MNSNASELMRAVNAFGADAQNCAWLQPCTGQQQDWHPHAALLGHFASLLGF